jgi:hypothetical protein
MHEKFTPSKPNHQYHFDALLRQRKFILLNVIGGHTDAKEAHVSTGCLLSPLATCFVIPGIGNHPVNMPLAAFSVSAILQLFTGGILGYVSPSRYRYFLRALSRLTCWPVESLLPLSSCHQIQFTGGRLSKHH